MTQPVPPPPPAAEVLERGLGRRDFMRAVATVTAAGALVSAGTRPAAAAPKASPTRTRLPGQVLQPGVGPIDGQHYLPSRVDEVRWGYLPQVDDEPVLSMGSGQTVTIDAMSHEGLLEDQGRDPVEYFKSKGVPRSKVLDDGIDIAASYARHTRSFDADGPHVVTGPISVTGAAPGDVLKIELLTALPRVPYGVISSRHGKGALAAGFVKSGDLRADETMPETVDGRPTGDPLQYGNISTFTPIGRSRDGVPSGFLPVGRRRQGATFPLDPFSGIMAVANVSGQPLTSPLVNSIPPTLGGGNIDVKLLAVGSAFYLPVTADGALFSVGDPHMAMGNGEVALTALEGSLRLTFRLTVCKPGAGDAPSVAFRYPFGETADAWIPIGLSDPDGAGGGVNVSNLDIASRRAVVNALDFLETDLGMDRATAYAYLSAAADFEVSQVVDRTVGVHGVIQKAHFR